MTIGKVMVGFSIAVACCALAEAEADTRSLASPPPLSEDQVETIMQLSRPELLELIESIEPSEPQAVWRLHHALLALRPGAYTIPEIERLVAVAKRNSQFGVVIVGHLAVTMYEGEPDKEDKQRVDRFVELMEQAITEDTAKSPAPYVAIHGLSALIHIKDKPHDKRRVVEKTNLPYAYDRVIAILTTCIDREDLPLRCEAIRLLGRRASLDLPTAKQTLPLLQIQLQNVCEAQRQSAGNLDPKVFEAWSHREELKVVLEAAVRLLQKSIHRMSGESETGEVPKN